MTTELKEGEEGDDEVKSICTGLLFENQELEDLMIKY